MKTHVFLITAKTNLHVGNESGGEFSIIDKAIQRDPLTGLPCINSSSLKGAIKEFCVHKTTLTNIAGIFGSDIEKETGKVKKDVPTQKGSAIFFDAKLLYLPQQGAPQESKNGDMLFHYVTTEKIKQMMVERIQLFDENFTEEKITRPSGFVDVISNDKFDERCQNDNLPIIARNVLENGESKNLWYEQVLPAETILYTIIQENVQGKETDHPETNNKEKKVDLLKALDGKIVQIGAGATIGYGYCKFECIYSKED